MDLQNKKNEVDKVRTIHESTAIIRENEQIMGRSAVRIGQELEYIKRNKTYKQLGYEDVIEYGESSLGYKKSHIYNLIKIGRDLKFQSSGKLEGYSIEKLALIANIDDYKEQDKSLEEMKKLTTKELRQAVKEKQEALEEKRKAEQAKIKTEGELERLREELEQVKNQPPKIEKEVIEKKVIPEDYREMKKQLAATKEEIETLEERAGRLDKYRSEIRGYSQKKKQVESEIADLLEYQRKLKEENDIVAQRAEIVQGIRSSVDKLKKEKARIEELTKKDVILENPDLKAISYSAEFLDEMSTLLYDYIATQKSIRNGDDIVEIN